MFSLIRYFLCIFVAKRYILHQKCLKEQIGLCLHAGTTFSHVHQPWEPECTALQTDGRTTGWCQ